ncbi:hypothetical protein [Cellulomonas bogoriensis]|uniref:Uncharacterized protein n=1 Tax=Cellulomonas bogoriensis 69B4 = DSM 16987 TaxID=1386082 RepID=A0A0A0BRK0_9CELL|nr:hypothetical protein [Cellulomonas bogoriensis]KGM10606.1 hypothetical protein N869_04425 [Cellulomonas bogoriensis 69B4 = DSM 16987]
MSTRPQALLVDGALLHLDPDLPDADRDGVVHTLLLAIHVATGRTTGGTDAVLSDMRSLAADVGWNVTDSGSTTTTLPLHGSALDAVAQSWKASAGATAAQGLQRSITTAGKDPRTSTTAWGRLPTDSGRGCLVVQATHASDGLVMLWTYVGVSPAADGPDFLEARSWRRTSMDLRHARMLANPAVFTTQMRKTLAAKVAGVVATEVIALT